LKLSINSTDTVFTPARIRIKDKVVKTSESIKICGIVFSNNAKTAYNENTLSKIVKLEKQIIWWLPRCLSLEGKILIAKTFGLSQIIYALQACEIKIQILEKLKILFLSFCGIKNGAGTGLQIGSKEIT